jgi:predicted Zn-dependent protease
LDSLAFQLVRAKLRVLTGRDPVQVQRDFERELASGQAGNRTAARYGHALALARAGKTEPAVVEMRALAQADPGNPALVAERGRLEQAAGDAGKAMQAFEQGLALHPGSGILTLGYAEALLKAGRAQDARQLLAHNRPEADPDPRYYRLLARSEELSGSLLEAHLAMAEYQYLMGHTRLAVEQLERARGGVGGNFYGISRIDARLAELKEELAQERARR